MNARGPQTWIIVTGMSGSGKSVALNTLEDLDFYCVDNLPVALVEEMLAHLYGSSRDVDRVALGLDIRSSGAGELDRLPGALQAVRDRVADNRIVFLTADDRTLLKRYSETRRKHPLEAGHQGLSRAIAEERRLLQPIRESADVLIDTTHLSIHQLRREICNSLGMGEQPLVLLIESFAFKHGVPADVDFVFDARCLPNPHWEPDLRPLTGRESEVQDYLEQHDIVHQYVQEICEWLERWLPHFESQHRNYLTVGIGCTGGKHRSVYIAERVASYFLERRDHVLTYHRELL